MAATSRPRLSGTFAMPRSGNHIPHALRHPEVRAPLARASKDEPQARRPIRCPRGVILRGLPAALTRCGRAPQDDGTVALQKAKPSISSTPF